MNVDNRGGAARFILKIQHSFVALTLCGAQSRASHTEHGEEEIHSRMIRKKRRKRAEAEEGCDYHRADVGNALHIRASDVQTVPRSVAKPYQKHQKEGKK